MKGESNLNTTGKKSTSEMLIFYSVSMLFATSIMVISTSIFVLFAYLNNGLPAVYYYLYILSLAISIFILVTSLRGLKRSYEQIVGMINSEKKIVIVKAEKTAVNQLNPAQGSSDDFYSLAEREIVDIIKDSGGRILQSSLTSKVNLSKAKISRTLTSLENKGVIVRMRKGVTNEIVLSEIDFTQ